MSSKIKEHTNNEQVPFPELYNQINSRKKELQQIIYVELKKVIDEKLQNKKQIYEKLYKSQKKMIKICLGRYVNITRPSWVSKFKWWWDDSLSPQEYGVADKMTYYSEYILDYIEKNFSESYPNVIFYMNAEKGGCCILELALK